MVNIIVISDKMDMPIHIVLSYDIVITSKEQADILVKAICTSCGFAAGILQGKKDYRSDVLEKAIREVCDMDGLRFYSDN